MWHLTGDGSKNGGSDTKDSRGFNTFPDSPRDDPGFPGPGVILLSVSVLLCSTQIKFSDPLTSLYLFLCSLPLFHPPLIPLRSPVHHFDHLPCLRYCCGNTTLTGAHFHGNCSPEKRPASTATTGRLLNTHTAF